MSEKELASSLDAALAHVDPDRRKFLGMLLVGVVAAPQLTSAALAAGSGPGNQRAGTRTNGGATSRGTQGANQNKGANSQLKYSGNQNKGANSQLKYSANQNKGANSQLKYSANQNKGANSQLKNNSALKN